MARKHGWQLPAHTFQVVAITVFCLLVVAFYAFFAPFLGGQIWEYVLVGTYSPVALLVFILYVRCTAINPADPGIMYKFDSRLINGSHPPKPSLPADCSKSDEMVVRNSPSSVSLSSSKRGSVGERAVSRQLEQASTKVPYCSSVGAVLCGVFVYEDCRKQEAPVEQQGSGEEALYCTLCEAEVRKFSKHCRSCDKCVDGFDHHCRWLNNCVGRKNYITFISLMAISIVWLVIEVGIGITVFVRCFTNKTSMETEIVDRLGDGFSRAPFATVVAICTSVSVLACVPLGELLFFHIILIRKGITTYEYVVAMRAMSEAPGGAGGSIEEELPDILLSPSGSATTGFSGGSSLGLPYKGVTWCTPPKVFVDYQEEVVPHLEPGRVPSTIDPDASGFPGRGSSKPPNKKAVKLSTWKLAKLNSQEAIRAGEKARASSSVMRPAADNRKHSIDPELSSSGNLSSIRSSSVSTEKDVYKNDFKSSSPPMKNSFAPSQGSRDEYETGTHSVGSSFSSPSHVHEPVSLSPLPQLHSYSQMGFNKLPLMEKNVRSGGDPLTLPVSTAAATTASSSLLRDVKKTSVVWDQEAGRYVSIPVSASEARNKFISQAGTVFDRRPAALPRESSSEPEKLTYTGDSIFFGGPLLSLPPFRDARRNSESSSLRQGQQVMLNMPRESRFKRDANSNQLPVFMPVSIETQNRPSVSGLKQ
ncbi:probable protein S-acyltransferase 19 [Impatiens glandulifera]|uniref:probable protein S-acyltransferase 19 n=1 Tax=Impatiens glandulifera TaxID=253017 RepID=UPI001FB14219|nr:probable protein S-acyltransferase 19 [Impatiens glandulifera]